jgi:hypothetical protein
MLALQINEAVDQAQLDIDARVGLQKLRQCGRQMPASKRGRRIDADTPFRRAL